MHAMDGVRPDGPEPTKGGAQAAALRATLPSGIRASERGDPNEADVSLLEPDELLAKKASPVGRSA